MAEATANVALDHGITVASHGAEFAAYDNLPRRIQVALQSATIKFSAIDVLREYRALSEEEGRLVAEIEISEQIASAR